MARLCKHHMSACRALVTLWEKCLKDKKFFPLNDFTTKWIMFSHLIECESSCAVVKRKKERSMLVKLRGGTAPFQIEIGRWQGVDREERVCKDCQCQEVEDVCHWLIRCPAWDLFRQPLMTEVNCCDRFKEQSHSEQTAIILSLSCTNPSILKHLSSMWYAHLGV